MIKVKLFVGISLLLFLISVGSLFTAGYIDYQAHKIARSLVTSTTNKDNTSTNNKISEVVGVDLTLDEVAKHATEADCWLVINNKVFNVSGYLASHPGGEPIILKYCGKDGTSGFVTKDKSSAVNHSQMAYGLLDQYFMGNLGQKISDTSVTVTPSFNKSNVISTVSPTNVVLSNAPVSGSGGGLTLTSAEVASHNNLQNCWMIISGKVYDVTTYISQHPGGAQMILNSCGKDGSSAYATKGGNGNSHSGYATGLLANYLIGSVGTVVVAVPTVKPVVVSNPTAVPVANNPTIAPVVVPPLTLTTTEISTHNTLQNCWLIISGKVYDVTTYISQHPGGAQIIVNSCGKDGTSAFQTKGGKGSNHSTNGYNLLNNYLIGSVGSSVAVNPTSVPAATPAPGSPTNVPSNFSCSNMPSVVCSKYPGATRKSGEYENSRWEGEANTPSNGCRHIKTNNNSISSDVSC